MIAIYCICDDCLKALNIKDDPQVKMSSAEVVATAIIAAKLFGGCFWRAQVFLCSHGYIPNMLSCSRFNRRMHALNIEVFALIISLISQVLKTRNRSAEYVVDSFPIAICENIRIFRCRLFTGEEYRGYCASKKTHFYGVKVHLITRVRGEPVLFAFSPGTLRQWIFRSIMAQYFMPTRLLNDYPFEQLLKEAEGVLLIPDRRRNMRRQWSGPTSYVQKICRKRIETAITAYPVPKSALS